VLGADENNQMNNQTKICRLLIPPGDTISLFMLPAFDAHVEERILTATLDVISTLSDIVCPIVANLAVAYREPESPFLEKDTSPKCKYWEIRESDLPDYVVIQNKSDDYSLAPQLSREILSSWFRQAFTQASATSNRVITFESLECSFTRSRLFNPSLWETVESFPLRDGDVMLKIPIEHYYNHLWVPGPVYGLSMYPAISFEIVNYDGMLNTKIWVGWSFWTEHGTSEHRALQEVLQKLVSQGWSPELMPPTFNL
jgi:hypothetical protein